MGRMATAPLSEITRARPIVSSRDVLWASTIVEAGSLPLTEGALRPIHRHPIDVTKAHLWGALFLLVSWSLGFIYYLCSWSATELSDTSYMTAEV